METRTMNQAPALLSGLADLNKKELTARAKNAIEHLAEEGGDVLALTAVAVKVKHFATELEKAGKAASYEELTRYERGTVGKQGVRLSTKETGVSYDYSGDTIWGQLRAEADAVLARLKQHEELLKALPTGGMGLTDPETGETYTAYRPTRTANQSVEATIL